jgi:hypothetical protein
MDVDLSHLSQVSDEDLIALVTGLRKEMQRRADDDKQASRDPKIASQLAMMGRGAARVWSGYAAVSRDTDGVIHLMQPDRDNRIVDIWLRCPESYPEDVVDKLEDVVISAVAGLVRH